MSPQNIPLRHKDYLELIILRRGCCRSCATGCKLPFCKEISIRKSVPSPYQEEGVLLPLGTSHNWPSHTTPQRLTNTQALFSFICSWGWCLNWWLGLPGSCSFLPGYPLCVHKIHMLIQFYLFSSSDFYYRVSQPITQRVKGKLLFPS